MRRLSSVTAERRGAAALVAAALLFSSTFLVVQGAVAHVAPFRFLSVRFALGSLALAPFAWRRPSSAGELRHGALAGVAMFGGFVLQTYGLQSTSTARSAFLTYLLVVLVPVLEAALARRRPSGLVVGSAALALVGLTLLTSPVGGGAGFGRGELLTVGCAVCFACHIVLLARVAPKHDPIRLTLVQLAVVAAASAAPGVLGGGGGFDSGTLAAAAYTGIGVSAVAFVLMVGAQRVVPAHRVALLLLVEPVAAAVAGRAAGERLGWSGWVGATLILAAIALAERKRAPQPETASPVGTA